MSDDSYTITLEQSIAITREALLFHRGDYEPSTSVEKDRRFPDEILVRDKFGACARISVSQSDEFVFITRKDDGYMKLAIVDNNETVRGFLPKKESRVVIVLTGGALFLGLTLSNVWITLPTEHLD